MNFLSDSQRGTTLTLESYPCWSILCLCEDVVSSLCEIALKEELKFIFLLGLPNQFQYFTFLFPIEIGSQRSTFSKICQSYTSLSFFLKIDLDDCNLSWFAYSKVNVIEVVVDSQLKYVHLSELLCEFGQFNPKTLPGILCQFYQSLLIS